MGGSAGLGLRAALGVLGSAFLATAPTVAFLFVPFTLGRSPGLNALFLVVTAGLSLLFSFLPLYVAANWLEVLRRAAGSESKNPPA